MINGADEACDYAALFGDDCGVNFRSDVIAELCFVNVKVAPDENNYVFVVNIFLIYDGFAKFFGRYIDKLAKVFDGFDVGSS